MSVLGAERRELSINVNGSSLPLPKLNEMWNTYSDPRKVDLWDIMNGLLQDGSMTPLAIAATGITDFDQELFRRQVSTRFMELMADRYLKKSTRDTSLIRIYQDQTWAFARTFTDWQPKMICGVLRGFSVPIPDAIDLRSAGGVTEITQIWRYKRRRLVSDPRKIDSSHKIFADMIKHPFFYQNRGSTEVQRVLSKIVPGFPGNPVRVRPTVDVKYITLGGKGAERGDLVIPMRENIHIWLSDSLVRDLMGMPEAILEAAG